MSDEDGGWLTPQERERQRAQVAAAVDRLQMAESSDERKVGVLLGGQALMVAGLIAAAWVSGGRLAIVIPVVVVCAAGLWATRGITSTMRADGSSAVARFRAGWVLLWAAGIVASLAALMR